MARRSELFASIGLALTLGFGPLHAQPADPEGRKADTPGGQGEASPATPVLKEPRSLAGMNLDFTHGAKLGEVFLNLSKQSGVSIILHSSVSGQEASTSADLRGLNFQRALDTLMLQNDLFYKVMDPGSIMVFKKTPQNLQEFETKLIKTFNLANGDVDNVRQTFNALMPQVRVITDRRLNAITVSGTPSELAKAQQIVNTMDRGRGEVRLLMEIVEVSHKASVTAGLLATIDAPPNPVALDQALAKVMQDSDSKLLASPDVRVISGEVGEVRFGRRAALPQEESGAKTLRNASTGKSEGTGPSSANDDPDVRIKVKPRLHPDHQITLDLEYEITDQLKAVDPGGPNLDERVLKTSVRIKDGETVVFGGLLEKEGRDKAPGGTSGGKDKKDRLLVVKATVVRWGEQ